MSSTAPPHNDLIQECLAFCERAGIKPTTFGQRAVKDRHFIQRLQGGGRCWPETDAKVRAYILDNMPAEDAA
jgi:hypothetical protein